MKPGRASRTAEYVCMGRAIADGRTLPGRYSDPTAFSLLPPDRQEIVERLRRGEKTYRPLRLLGRAYLLRQALVMVARTVGIDDAIREANAPQLVILGAGLDGRAFRMSELRDATVFEIDHPDSQRDKRARAEKLKQTAKAVHFVPVDFERDSLDAALEKAGHDRTRPTTWVWEGVVMYLDHAAIEATLKVIDERSTPGSRLVLNYHSPFWIRSLLGLVVRAVGEPLKSHFTVPQMGALLQRHHFSVKRDENMVEIGSRLDPALGEQVRRIGHLRIAVADRS